MRSLWKKLAGMMRMNKSELRGTKEVFRFSLQQYFKSTATYVMLVVMFLGTAMSVLLSGMGMNRGAEAGTDAATVYILNGSPYSPDFAVVLPDYVRSESRDGTLEALLDELDAGETRSVAAEIRWDDELADWNVTCYTGKDSLVSQMEAEDLADYCAAALEEARYRALNVSEEQISLALAPTELDIVKEADLQESEEEDGFQKHYIVGFACSVLVFMLISFSTSFIVRAVAEEKNSKLVEVLMLSVKPLALVAGKILAALCLVLVGAAVAGVGLVVSKEVLTLLGQDAGDTVAGLSEALQGLSAGGILALLVSLILGYLSYAVMAGISGACCSTTSDADGAASTVMITAMVGYMTGVGTSMVGSGPVMTVISVLPFLSPFIAPGRYMNGQLPFWALPVSWVLQAAALVLLAKGCAGVYGALIFHRGERVKLKQVLQMMKQEAEA